MSYWRGKVIPLPDELLTSWLIRLARRVGLTVYGLVRQVLHNESLFCRDTDLLIRSSALQSLASFADIDVLQLKEHTLQVDCPARTNGVTPGVLAYGIYHRKRKRHGLQYCPKCLAHEPYLRKEWRFALQFGCPIHGVLLLDACPRCDAPLMPHRRYDGNFAKCSECSASLIIESTELHDDDIAVCKAINRLYVTKEIKIGQQTVTIDQAIAGLRVLFGFVATDPGAPDLLGRLRDKIDVPPPRLRFDSLETSRVDFRTWAIPLCYSLFTNWPDRFIDLCHDCGIVRSRVADPRLKGLPQWLLTTLERLPQSDRRKRGRRRKSRRKSRGPHFIHASYAQAIRQIDLSVFLSRELESFNSDPRR